MISVKFECRTPEENLALDELLLSRAEAGEIGETLRFWESPKYFIALGRASAINDDVNIEKCINDDIRVVRRVSGGGTVLQGPGCMNFSMVLSIDRDEMTRTVSRSYRYILDKVAEGFRNDGQDVKFHPVSDLALGDKKFSGNAQARKKKYFLHHGTVMYFFEIDRMGGYLKHPKDEPKYRKARAHADFVTNLRLHPDRIQEIIKTAFPCDGEADLLKRYLFDVEKLAIDKYADDKWNYAF
jgi:lipoate-protein ligase A